jgi:hypothetical protein
VGGRILEVQTTGSSWVTFVHARVVFCLMLLQIYPCNNAKYINKIQMGHDVKDTLKDSGKL